MENTEDYSITGRRVLIKPILVRSNRAEWFFEANLYELNENLKELIKKQCTDHAVPKLDLLERKILTYKNQETLGKDQKILTGINAIVEFLMQMQIQIQINHWSIIGKHNGYMIETYPQKNKKPLAFARKLAEWPQNFHPPKDEISVFTFHSIPETFWDKIKA
jgi:hypothetical protein